jgi:hypothetical protein
MAVRAKARQNSVLIISKVLVATRPVPPLSIPSASSEQQHVAIPMASSSSSAIRAELQDALGLIQRGVRLPSRTSAFSIDRFYFQMIDKEYQRAVDLMIEVISAAFPSQAGAGAR